MQMSNQEVIDLEDDAGSNKITDAVHVHRPWES